MTHRHDTDPQRSQTLKCIIEKRKGWDGVDWIHLAKGRD
jgi:hypothetical protein